MLLQFLNKPLRVIYVATCNCQFATHSSLYFNFFCCTPLYFIMHSEVCQIPDKRFYWKYFRSLYENCVEKKKLVSNIPKQVKYFKFISQHLDKMSSPSENVMKISEVASFFIIFYFSLFVRNSCLAYYIPRYLPHQSSPLRHNNTGQIKTSWTVKQTNIPYTSIYNAQYWFSRGGGMSVFHNIFLLL